MNEVEDHGAKLMLSLPELSKHFDPAVSQAQRAYLNAHFGHAWVKRHHFDNKGKLPAHVSPQKGQ